MSCSHDRPESRVSPENSEFDLSRVEEYLDSEGIPVEIKFLRREFALRNSSDVCKMKAKKVLAHFQGVYCAVKERDDAKTHVEWIYSQFVDCLYFHLAGVASFPGLAQEPDKNDRDQVQRAAKDFLKFVRPAPISMKDLVPGPRPNHRDEANRDLSRESERKRDPPADRGHGSKIFGWPN